MDREVIYICNLRGQYIVEGFALAAHAEHSRGVTRPMDSDIMFKGFYVESSVGYWHRTHSEEESTEPVRISSIFSRPDIWMSSARALLTQVHCDWSIRCVYLMCIAVVLLGKAYSSIYCKHLTEEMRVKYILQTRTRARKPRHREETGFITQDDSILQF